MNILPITREDWLAFKKTFLTFFYVCVGFALWITGLVMIMFNFSDLPVGPTVFFAYIALTICTMFGVFAVTENRRRRRCE